MTIIFRLAYPTLWIKWGWGKAKVKVGLPSTDFYSRSLCLKPWVSWYICSAFPVFIVLHCGIIPWWSEEIYQNSNASQNLNLSLEFLHFQEYFISHFPQLFILFPTFLQHGNVFSHFSSSCQIPVYCSIFVECWYWTYLLPHTWMNHCLCFWKRVFLF